MLSHVFPRLLYNRGASCYNGLHSHIGESPRNHDPSIHALWRLCFDQYNRPLGNVLEMIRMPVNKHICNLVHDLVVNCDSAGEIIYANPAAQCWSSRELQGNSFVDLLLEDSKEKGQRFLDTVQMTSWETPTSPWELIIGKKHHYAVAAFRGYREEEILYIVGNVQAETVDKMQQAMSELTSELAEAQRKVYRQNLALQNALQEQRRLVRTILHLTSPAVPVWDGAIILSLLTHTETETRRKMVREVWQRTGERHTQYVILDMSDVTIVQDAIIYRLVEVVHELQHNGIQPVLTDSGSGLTSAMVQLGIETNGLSICNDVHEAITHIGALNLANDVGAEAQRRI